MPGGPPVAVPGSRSAPRRTTNAAPHCTDCTPPYTCRALAHSVRCRSAPLPNPRLPKPPNRLGRRPHAQRGAAQAGAGCPTRWMRKLPADGPAHIGIRSRQPVAPGSATPTIPDIVSLTPAESEHRATKPRGAHLVPTPARLRRGKRLWLRRLRPPEAGGRQTITPARMACGIA
jgi:hypothetical protein